jgi:hypothetical protein
VSVRKEVKPAESFVIADGAGHTFFEEGPPMWTTANRPRDKRDKLRYPSDGAGEEWAHIEALIPPAKYDGRKRTVDVREFVNGRSKLCKQRLRRSTC